MPLDARLIATKIAVTFFFTLGLIGSAVGLTPFTACKRALAGALLAYLVAILAVKAINAILIDAMITKHLEREKEQEYGSAY
jgi:hypothetical protein